MTRTSGRPATPAGRPEVCLPWWNIGRGPLALLVVLVSLLSTAGAAADHLRTQIAADVAADNGAGPRLILRRPVVRHAAPVTVTIDRLALRSDLIDLRKNPNGTVQVPQDVTKVGWYVGSAHPGDAGPTVLIGHVDSYKGRAVFYHLRDLRKGDLIRIARSDRSQAVFTVQDVRRYPKRNFPTAQVYVGNGRPSLRLVTCGGAFDRRTGHYLDNTVVFAVPYVAPRSHKPLSPHRHALL